MGEGKGECFVSGHSFDVNVEGRVFGTAEHGVDETNVKGEMPRK